MDKKGKKTVAIASAANSNAPPAIGRGEETDGRSERVENDRAATRRRRSRTGQDQRPIAIAVDRPASRSRSGTPGGSRRSRGCLGLQDSIVPVMRVVAVIMRPPRLRAMDAMPEKLVVHGYDVNRRTAVRTTANHVVIRLVDRDAISASRAGRRVGHRPSRRSDRRYPPGRSCNRREIGTPTSRSFGPGDPRSCRSRVGPDRGWPRTCALRGGERP